MSVPVPAFPADHPLAKPGPVERELRRLQGFSARELYGWNPRTKRYGRLSSAARIVIRDAHRAITGMQCGVNDYWLPEVLSEAIEAAEALDL